jgi:5'-nucleotidase/UDP-sugar diphosphatase
MCCQLRGVDAMVGGDTHTLLGDTAKLSVVPGAMPEGVFPTMVTNLDGKKVCVVQAWHYAHAVGKLSISFDANGDVTSCGGGPQFPLADSSSFVTTPPRGQTGNPLSAEDQALVVAKLLENNAMVTEEHVATKAWIDTNKGEISSMQNEVIATFDQAYCLARFPQFQSSTICTGCESYVHGGPACALVAKGFLMIEKTADIAIQNGGGCRSDLAMGDFSIGDAYTMLPFANTMLTLKMTGAQIKMVLEEALSQPLDRGGSSGSYPYASGLRYNVDASKPFPHRVSNVEVNSRLQGQWSPIDLEHEYTVVTNNYIAGMCFL